MAKGKQQPQKGSETPKGSEPPKGEVKGEVKTEIKGEVGSIALKGRLKGTYGTMYYVKDMKDAVKFYADFLGMKPAFESPEWTEFRAAAGHSLCLHLSEGKGDQAANGTLILHVDKIKDVVADLKKGGRPASEPHEVHPGAYSADFKDQNGNVIGLYEGPKS